MKSKILYDTQNNSIMRCQPEPKGSAGIPSFGGLCKSARIPEDNKQYMDTCIIDNEVLTNQAINELRILNNEAVNKPRINITTDKTEVILSDNPQFAITVEIIETIETDSFSTVQMAVNDVNFLINITDNIGSKTIELSEADAYTISCIDDRFFSQSAEVVVVE